MRRPLSILLLCALVAGSLPAATELSGATPGGAFYRIVVPDAWNGSLVIYNHGFSLSPPSPDPDLGLLADLQLLQGFAVAASSYRQAGWAVFKSNQDLRALMEVFRAGFGEPLSVLLYGGSLGGLVTVAAVEKGGLGNVVGALSFCGVIGGSRNWNGALDLRLAYDEVCSRTPAARLPGGAAGLPRDADLAVEDVRAAVNACTGVDLAPAERTAAQKRNLKRLLALGAIPESFLQTVMGYATFGLADLVHSRDKLRGRVGLGNAGVDYGDRKINRAIERVEPDRRGARKLRRSFTPSGRVGATKVLAIHTDKDGLVVVENLGEYANVAPAASLTTAVVVEEEPSHCLFTVSEGLAAWEGLLGWVETGIQPSAADLQTSCLELEPVFGGPCRIDPDFPIADLDERIRPR